MSQTDYQATDNFGYFIQNDIKTLDQPGEWYYDAASKKTYLYSGYSAPRHIEVSAIDNLVKLDHQSDVTFTNVSFVGSNRSALNIHHAKHITISHCSIAQAGVDGIYGFSLVGFTLQHASLTGCNNNAVYLAYHCDSTIIRNNVVKNTGLNMGMGDASQYNSFCGILIGGTPPVHSSHTLVEYNDIDSTGYNGISFSGDHVTIKNNVVNSFCCTKDDGGGIYTYGNLLPAGYTDRNITNNIVLNGRSAGEGTPEPLQPATWGIYLDDNAEAVSINGNTVAHMPSSGIFLHNAQLVTIRNNTLYNCAEQLCFGHDDTGAPIRDVTVAHNVFFAKYPHQWCFRFTTTGTDLDQFGTADSNYYCRPLNEDNSIFTLDANRFASYNIRTWSLMHRVDVHSASTFTPIAHYTLTQRLGDNKVVNGDYVAGISGTECYHPSGSCVAALDETGMINGGSLRITSVNNSAGTTYVTLDIGDVKASDNYLLTYSTASSKEGACTGVYLRQSESPFNRLSAIDYNYMSTNKMDHQVLFAAPVSESKAAVVFETNTVDSTFWLDNVTLYKANVAVSHPDGFIRFEYNETKANKTIWLNGSYVGVDGKSYTRSVTLTPYTSLILIKMDQFPTQHLPHE